MDDRQARYEEYRKKLTGPVGRQMSEKLKDTVYSYTNVSGRSDTKLILLGFLSGIMLALSSRPSSSILRSALIAVAIISFIYAAYTASENRRKRGEDAFYRYLYNQIISEAVRRDCDSQTAVLLNDMQCHMKRLTIFVPKELDELRNVDEFKERARNLGELQYYEGLLKEDYWFSKSMHDYLSG